MRFRCFGAAARAAAPPASAVCQGRQTMAFVDHAYLLHEGARALGVDPRLSVTDARALVRWLGAFAGEGVARLYWYAAAFDSADPRHARQRRELRKLAQVEPVQLRLGYIKEEAPEWLRDVLESLDVDPRVVREQMSRRSLQRQKAVDTQLAIDLAGLAERGVLGRALLLAGDGDFAPAARVARDAGIGVTVIAPTRFSVARTLRELADHVIEIPADGLAEIVRRNDGAPNRQVGQHGRWRRRATDEGTGHEDAPGGAKRRDDPGASARVFSELAIATTDGSGVRYMPFVEPDRAGYVVERPDGRTARIYLNPSRHDGAGQATVVLFAGQHSDPARDTPLDFHHPFEPAGTPCPSPRLADRRATGGRELPGKAPPRRDT